jgi:hypothetical protein
MSKELKRDTRTQRSKPAPAAGDQQRESAQHASTNLYTRFRCAIVRGTILSRRLGP